MADSPVEITLPATSPVVGSRVGSVTLPSDTTLVTIVRDRKVITPSSDPYTMLAMMIPMYVFYEAAIIIGRLMKK